MPIIAGVDGCPGGWICVMMSLPDGVIRSAIYANARDLFCQDTLPDIIAIDIPLGLTKGDPRLCDQQARKLLGSPRRSSIFPAPIRPALAAKDRLQASNLTFQANGHKVGVQSWGIFRKIREVDEMLRSNSHLIKRVCEVHPELCFWAWNGQHPMKHPKKTTAGKAERRRLIDDYFWPTAVDNVCATSPTLEVGLDDIHDAFAALWTAARVYTAIAKVIPDPPPLDSEGLPMGMWY